MLGRSRKFKPGHAVSVKFHCKVPVKGLHDVYRDESELEPGHVVSIDFIAGIVRVRFIREDLLMDCPEEDVYAR